MPQPKSYNERLADAAAAHAIDLLRYDSDTRARILGFLARLQVTLAERLRLFRIGRSGTEATRLRLRTIYAQVAETVAQTFAEMAETHAGLMTELAAAESAFAVEQFREVAVRARIGVNLLTRTQLRRLAIGTAIDGAPSREWWSRQAADLMHRFRSEVNEGIALGETNEQIVQRIRGRATGRRNVYEIAGRRATYVEFKGGVLDTSTRHAMALVRTSVQSVAAASNRDTYEENQDVVMGIVQISTLDTRTTPTCIAYGGKAWALPDYTPIGHDLPYSSGVPRHWNCVPGDSLVAPIGRIAAGYERPFEGDLVVIRTARGRELPCTPNHPVLTRRGWVAARLLRVGDHVVCNRVGERRSFLDRDHQKMPSRIQDVARSFVNSGGVLSVPVPLSSEDFHGDAREGEVAVVRTDCLLRDGSQSARAQHLHQFALGARRATVAALLEGRSHLAFLLEGARASAHRIVRGFHLSPTLCVAGVGPSGSLLIGSPTRFQPARSERIDNRRTARLESLGQFGDSDPLKEEMRNGVRIGRPTTSAACDSMLSQRAVDHLFSDAESFLQVDRPGAALVRARDGSSVGLRAETADAHATSAEMLANGGNADAELARDLRAGAAGAVELDEVVDLGVRHWSGHVFNLETGSGAFIANGIVTHNCRSREAPVLRSWQELGINLAESPGGTRWSRLDGQVPADLTMDDFLRRRTAAQVDEMLGEGVADLWRAGQITVEDLIDRQTGRPLSLGELTARFGRAA